MTEVFGERSRAPEEKRPMTRLGKGSALGVLAALGVAMAAAAPHAFAAQAAAGGPFGSGNAPIDISADELEVIDAESRAVWRGNVEAVQGTSRLRAPTLSIYYASSGAGGQAIPGAPGGEIQRMEADGPVYYVTAGQNARGDRAIYESAASTVTLIGNVVLVQDRNVVRGERLVIDTRTSKATLTPTAAGRGQPGRVRGVFYPNQTQQPGAAARP